MDNIKKNNFYKKRWYAKKKGTTKENNARGTSGKEAQRSVADNTIVRRDDDTNIPYYGWTLYFSEKEYKNSDDISAKVKAVEQFLKRNSRESLSLTLASLEAGVTFAIDFHVLRNDDIFLTEWTNFTSDIQEKPTHTINCIKLAIHQVILSTVSKQNLANIANSINLLPLVKVKILNYDQVTSLRDIKVNSYGKLITTSGCVTRVGRRKHSALWLTFACSKCGLEKIHKQPEGVYTPPKKCTICGPSGFLPVLNSSYVKSSPFQTITIQEILSNEQENKGRVPRILDVKITDDSVDTCMPGDDLTLTGIIKVHGIDDGSYKGNIASSFSLYMEAITIIHKNINTKNENKDKKTINSDSTVNETNTKDYLSIKEVYSKSNIFALLVQSLCPGIYGYEIIKAGLLLSLFGGNAKRKGIRDHIHVLIVGDPGLGKSQMLQACTRVSSKGVYICGHSSTSSGLTVTLTKENGTNDFALEPGALVLADGGCCCIDEFDKMSAQHQALLESMEQQSVSVAKSGILCSLPSRTSILAAANPIGGKYDRSKTISQNLNISQPLLSRFDLIFLLLDDPNKQRDHLICKHIMASHLGVNRKVDNVAREGASTTTTTTTTHSRCDSLTEKLTTSSSTSTGDIIPQIILGKYISYARQYVNPKLTTKAADVLQRYYLELRSRNVEFGGIPIYNRQLEAMIRLTEARAKLELRTEATESDAEEVIEILEHTMGNTLENSGRLESAIETTSKINRNKGNKVKSFVTLVEKERKCKRQETFSIRQLNDIARNGGIHIPDFPLFVSKLNEQGVLLQVERNSYRLSKA